MLYLTRVQNLPNAAGRSSLEKVYSLWIGDLVGVGLGENGANMVYTLTAKRRPKSVSLYIKADDEEDEDEGESSGAGAAASRNRKALTNGGAAAGNDALLGRGHRRAITENKMRVCHRCLKHSLLFTNVAARAAMKLL